MQTLLNDFRYGLRLLAKSPSFTVISVLTLALGIGANTAIFSAVNAILLKPLPYPSFSRLVEISSEKFSGSAGSAVGLIEMVAPATALDVEKQCPAFEGLTTYNFGQSYTLTGQFAPELLSGTAVSGNFFTFLGVRPLLGRPILPTDTKPGNGDVAVLSYDLWKGLLGGDPHWIGRRLTLNGKPYTVIGVMPPKFNMEASPTHGIWLPRVAASDDATDRASRFWGVLGRLKPGTTIAKAQVQLNTLGERLAGAYPETDRGWTLLARDPFRTESQIKEGLLLLLGAAGFVLLIACVNLSGLLLARGWARQTGVAIRDALGATRLRIIRQFLSESALLALAGGALGLLFSFWAIRVLRMLAEPYTSNITNIQLSVPVLLFTLGVALLAGILFGLAPSLQISARRTRGALKNNLVGALTGSSGRHPRKLRGALVVAEVSLAVILVIGATLVARSFEKLTAVKLGFRTDHILTLGVNFSKPVCNPDNQNSETQCALAINDVLSRVGSLHGVESAAVASGIPGRGAAVGMDLEVEGQMQKIGFSEGSPVFERSVSPDYFDAVGMRFVEGKGFTTADIEGRQLVAVVNRDFAKKFLAGRPLGKRVTERKDKVGHPEWMTIVGEVNDSYDVSIGWRVMPELYLPYTQSKDRLAEPTLIVRTAADPTAIAAAVKQQIWAVDRDAPVTGLTTMDQIVSDSFAQPKFQAVLLGSFGLLGLILATVGIYGVISYSVTQRTHEIGVRMTLGARPTNVLRMVIREGMMLAGIGIVAGIGGALALGRVLRSLLFEITPTDPTTFVGVSIAVAFVALLACYIPALRALRVDPMVALRYE
jgi:predicted permease